MLRRRKFESLVIQIEGNGHATPKDYIFSMCSKVAPKNMNLSQDLMKNHDFLIFIFFSTSNSQQLEKFELSTVDFINPAYVFDRK